MPWRLLIFLLIMTLVIFFAGFNINNEADISFGFYTIKDVPIFISLFISFLLGAFIMLPFTIFKKKPSKKKIEKEEKKEKKKAEEENKRQKKKSRNKKSDTSEVPLSEDTLKE